jgi:cytochrome c2
MSDPTRSSDALWTWFGVSSFIFLVVLAISPLKDYFREYRRYQNSYGDLLLAHAGSRREVQEAEAMSVGIRQMWIPELNNRVDRCVSCHLGVEDPRMAEEAQPYRSHPPIPHVPGDLEDFGCVICHRGQGRATAIADAHGEVADWDSPLLPLRYTEASCGQCHEGTQVPEASLLSEGRALIERAGCYGCHELAGHEDWRSDAPTLDGIDQKTHVEWLRAWLRDPDALRPGTRMPDFALPDEEVDALAAFLWAQPPTSGQVLAESDLEEQGDYDRGRRVFRESRCISCHTVEGKGNGSAPELMGLASKVNRRWLLSYLENPHAFQPDVAMPQYVLDRGRLVDLVQYMVKELIDPSAPAPADPYRPPIKQIEAGEKLYKQYGCSGCHRIAGRDDFARIGPELNGIGEKPAKLLDFGERSDLPRSLADWLAAKVTDPRSFRPGLKMPVLGLEPEEVQAVVTALLACSRERPPETMLVKAEPGDYRPPGRLGRLVARYRCQSCHVIRGTGDDISTAPLTYQGSKVKRQWLEDYLLVPTTIRPLLTDRMVPLGMPRDEAAFLADMMQNVYVKDEIPGDLFPAGPPPERIERGRRLYHERYGCQACHMVDNRGGYYGPLMNGLGDRLKPGWVSWWLQGPQRWRDDVRCPDHGMKRGDAEDLAAYIASISKPTEPEAPARIGGAR